MQRNIVIEKRLLQQVARIERTSAQELHDVLRDKPRVPLAEVLSGLRVKYRT